MHAIEYLFYTKGRTHHVLAMRYIHCTWCYGWAIYSPVGNLCLLHIFREHLLDVLTELHQAGSIIHRHCVWRKG